MGAIGGGTRSSCLVNLSRLESGRASDVIVVAASEVFERRPVGRSAQVLSSHAPGFYDHIMTFAGVRQSSGGQAVLAFGSPLKLVFQGRANVARDCKSAINLLVFQRPSIAQTIRAVHSVQQRTGGK